MQVADVPKAPIEINGVFFQDVYYQPMGKGLGGDAKGLYEVKDPPNTGWSRALVIWPEDNQDTSKSKRRRAAAKRVTVFCPYTLRSYHVRFTAREVANQKAYPLTPELIDSLSTIIDRNWKMYTGFGFQKAYDVAALVLTRLGQPVPSYLPPRLEDLEYDEDSVPNRHGKPVGRELLRPVNPNTKRGQVCQFFLSDGGTGSIREAMAQFDISRSGALTHLHGLHKSHGLGYVLQGDLVTVMLPPGCTDPMLGGAQATEHKRVISKTTKRAGKPCADEVTDLPKKGKRLMVALSTLTEVPLSEVADKAGCSINSVRSHLHDLHTKHGFGYELSEDKSRGKLLTPPGWAYQDPTDPLA